MATRTTRSKKTVGDIISDSVSSERHLKNFMATNLKKVASVMIERKVTNKKVAKYCIKTDDSELLLADMKENMTLDDFLGFLEILTEFGSCEGYDGETRILMRLMKGSLEAMEPEPNSEHAAVISRFISVAFDRSLSPTVKSQPPTTAEVATLSETETKESISDPKQLTLAISTQQTTIPSEPPPGQFRDSTSHCFTREGGVLYSPLHGVTVTIPPNAIPGGVDTFNLSMHFYLGHPFTVEENVDLCSVVVWFHLHPHLEFLEDVTVEIPHAANSHDISLCVLTWGEDKQGPPYKLDTEVPADFSDGYHAVFNVKHFCPHGVGRKSRKKGKGAVSKAKKSMIQASGMRYSIVCCMPSDQSGAQWEVKFAATYGHPTGNWVTYIFS